MCSPQMAHCRRRRSVRQRANESTAGARARAPQEAILHRLFVFLLAMLATGCQTLNLAALGQPAAEKSVETAAGASAAHEESPAAIIKLGEPKKASNERTSREATEREAMFADLERQLGSDIWFQASRGLREVDWLHDHLNDQPPALRGGAATPTPNRTSASGGSSTSEYRWRHVGVEEILARPIERRPDLRAALASERRVVAANAAIALARLDDEAAVPALLEAVHSSELNLPNRRAAAEALGYLTVPAAEQALGELLDEYGRFGPGVQTYLPELHAELLRSLARQAPPGADERYAQAMKSAAAEVRIVALAAVAEQPHAELPPAAHELRYDPDRRVRQVALWALAKSGTSDAAATIATGLRDHELTVQIASIRALGQLGGEAARVPLEEQLGAQRPELVRIAAAEALVAMKSESSLRLAVADKSWRVRGAVARGLGSFRGAEASLLGARLLTDHSPMVQSAAVEAIAAWPFEEAAPLWLMAVERPGYAVRKAALGHLAEHWPEAQNFPIDAPFDEQRDELAALHERAAAKGIVATKPPDDDALLAAGSTSAADPPARTTSQSASANAGVSLASHTSLPPHSSDSAYTAQLARVEQLLALVEQSSANAAERAAALQSLAAMEDDLLAPLTVLALERRRPVPEVLYRNVLPERDEVFETLLRLESQDVVERRRAAASLVARVRERPLPRLALVRLAEKVLLERDADVWRSALVVVEAETDESALRLTYAALTHESSDVRRRACEHLARHAEPRHATVLVPALADSDQTVVRAAVRALGEPRLLTDPRPVEALLATHDRFVQLEAARTLARAGYESGRAALERLAYDLDLDVRMQAVRTMGEAPQHEFTSALIHSLDGPPGLKRAAAASLTAIVGQDIGRGADTTPVSLDEQAIRWRRWWQREQDPTTATTTVAPRETTAANAPLSVQPAAAGQSQSRAKSYSPRNDGQ